MGKREREETLNKPRCLEFVRRLWERDELRMFHHPVSSSKLPDYHNIIKCPVDLTTIREGIESDKYGSDADVQNAVALMIANALEYNAKGSEWHRQALSFRKTYVDLARDCGLRPDADAAYIPSAGFKDDESTLRRAEKKHMENLDVVLKDLEEEKEMSLEELKAKYRRTDNDARGASNEKGGDVSSDGAEEGEEEDEDDDDEENSEDSDTDTDDEEDDDDDDNDDNDDDDDEDDS